MWSCGRKTKIIKDSPRPDYMWVEDWQRICKNKKLATEVIDEWKNVLKPKVLQARRNRKIKDHVAIDDVDDYKIKLKAAQDKYAVNAVPNMMLANEAIEPLVDVAHRLHVHEDVFKAYLGIAEDDEELHYISLLQHPPCDHDNGAGLRELAEGDKSTSNCADTRVPASDDVDNEMMLLQQLEDNTS